MRRVAASTTGIPNACGAGSLSSPLGRKCPLIIQIGFVQYQQPFLYYLHNCLEIVSLSWPLEAIPRDSWSCPYSLSIRVHPRGLACQNYSLDAVWSHQGGSIVYQLDGHSRRIEKEHLAGVPPGGPQTVDEFHCFPLMFIKKDLLLSHGLISFETSHNLIMVSLEFATHAH